MIAGETNGYTKTDGSRRVAAWSHGDLDLIRQTAANVIRAVHTLSESFAEPDEDGGNRD